MTKQENILLIKAKMHIREAMLDMASADGILEEDWHDQDDNEIEILRDKAYKKMLAAYKIMLELEI